MNSFSDQIKQIGVVFDEMAPQYTTVMETMVPGYREMLATLVAGNPGSGRVERIIDLGCGNGNLTALIRAAFPEARIQLVDASKEMINLCRQRFGTENMEFTTSLFQDLSLEEDRYDFAVAGFSFHHLKGDEKPGMLRKVYHALGKNGVFGMTDLFIDKNNVDVHTAFMESWRRFMMSNGNTDSDWEWLVDHYTKYDHPDTYENYTMWLEQAGFERVTVSWSEGPWGCIHAVK